MMGSIVEKLKNPTIELYIQSDPLFEITALLTHTKQLTFDNFLPAECRKFQKIALHESGLKGVN